MMPNFPRRALRGLPLVVGLAALIGVPSPARADLAIPTEVLIEDQAANTLFLLYFEGIDLKARLPYTSLNMASGDFTHATSPGATYLGQAFSNSSSATYASVTDTYTFGSTASLGAKTWTTEGTASLTRPSDNVVITTYDYSYFDAAHVKKGGLHITTTVTGAGPLIFYPCTSSEVGYLTDPGGIKIPGTDFTSVDYLRVTGQWFNRTMPDEFDPYQYGFTDPVTGVGFSLVTFRAVPEPSSVALMGAGGLGLLVCVGRRRRAISDQPGDVERGYFPS